MIDKLTIYSKPTNIHNIQGRFYNVYLNKNTNLDLTSIINSNKSSVQQHTITLNKDEYNKLLMLIDTSTKLYSQSQELARKINKGRSKQ